MKLVYYFKERMEDFISRESRKVLIVLVREDPFNLGEEEVIAKGSIDISEFQSRRVLRKSYHCILSGKGFSTMLELHVGHHTHSHLVDVQNIPLLKFSEGIYLPPQNYFGHDVLPSEWIDILPRRMSLSKTRTIRETRTPAPKGSELVLESPIQSTL